MESKKIDKIELNDLKIPLGLLVGFLNFAKDKNIEVKELICYSNTTNDLKQDIYLINFVDVENNELTFILVRKFGRTIRKEITKTLKK